jgi:cytochrome c peroxidase
MHNGSIKTLAEVVSYLNEGGSNDPGKTPLLKNRHLSSQEQTALVAFLESLSGTVPEIHRPHLPGD